MPRWTKPVRFLLIVGIAAGLGAVGTSFWMKRGQVPPVIAPNVIPERVAGVKLQTPQYAVYRGAHLENHQTLLPMPEVPRLEDEVEDQGETKAAVPAQSGGVEANASSQAVANGGRLMAEASNGGVDRESRKTDTKLSVENSQQKSVLGTETVQLQPSVAQMDKGGAVSKTTGVSANASSALSREAERPVLNPSRLVARALGAIPGDTIEASGRRKGSVLDQDHRAALLLPQGTTSAQAKDIVRGWRSVLSQSVSATIEQGRRGASVLYRVVLTAKTPQALERVLAALKRKGYCAQGRH